MGREMNVLEIFQAIKKRISILILTVISIGIVVGGVSYVLNDKVYSSTISLIVGTESQRDTDEINELTGEPIQETYIKYGNHTISKETNKFYREILRSNDLLNEVIDKQNLGLSEKDLSSSISMENPEDSGTILISIENSNITKVDEIAEEVAAIFINKNLELTELDNIKIMNQATAPEKKNTVNILKNTLLSVIVGLGLSVVLIIILEYLDNTIENKDEIENNLNIPFLGQISKDTSMEDLKNIRTYLLKKFREKNKKVITFAGINTEPKVFTSELATEFTKLSEKILLIDANLRDPHIEKQFNLSTELGISNVLDEETSFKQAVYKYNNNLDILTTKQIEENSSEKLAKKSMKKLLENVSELYNFVFIDSHSLLKVTDTLVYSDYTDGIILFAEVGKTKIKDIQSVKQQLDSLGIEILGLILT